jgi:hypothetical protein
LRHDARATASRRIDHRRAARTARISHERNDPNSEKPAETRLARGKKMDELIAVIRKAVAPGADDGERVAGADACRSLLAVLDTEPGKPLVPPPAPTTPIAAVVEQIRGAPPGVVLDALIAKLKSYLPPDAGPIEPAVRAVKIPFVPLPAVKKEP